MDRQYVLMAQQVAHHTFNVGVKGSSPFRYTIKNLDNFFRTIIVVILKPNSCWARKKAASEKALSPFGFSR